MKLFYCYVRVHISNSYNETTEHWKWLRTLPLRCFSAKLLGNMTLKRELMSYPNAEEDKAVQLLQFVSNNQWTVCNCSEWFLDLTVFIFEKSFTTNIQNIVKYWGMAVSLTVQNLCVLLDDLSFKASWTFFHCFSIQNVQRKILQIFATGECIGTVQIVICSYYM